MQAIRRLATLAFLVGFPLAARPAPDAASALGEARKLLADSKPAEALAKAEEGLEYDPDAFDLLELASKAAQAANATDKALWYGGLALDAAARETSKERARLADELQARLTALDPLQGKAQAARDEYDAALLAIGLNAVKRKAWVSAAALLARADGDAADKALGKVFDDKKAVEALLDSGADVPMRQKKKRTPKEIAKLDAAHSEWSKAHEIKGAQYTIRTNMSIEIAEAFSSAMEQMNRYYRNVFGVKERGGETPRVTIKVYRSRAEFDEYEKKETVDGELMPLEKSVLGFFSPSELAVCTYDPREQGFSLSELWSTLFHEASHQFTHLALPARAEPIWLNEGTASYFEGARLLANGALQANLVAGDRLEQLVASLDAKSLNLTQVVTCPDGEAYGAEHYPFGWGLVYFFHNYEDERSQRVYLEPYRRYLLSYKSGAKHDVKARFLEYFVTKPKLAGVASFDDFEQRWSVWIRELQRLYGGGVEVADELIERARRQRSNKQLDAAVETYGWALKKRPGDAVALSELGELLAAQKKDDAAAWTFRQAYESVRAMADTSAKLPASGDLHARDVGEAALAQLAKLDKSLAEGLGAADSKFETTLVEVSNAFAQAHLPLTALLFLDRSRAVLGRSARIEAARTTLAKASGADPRRTRRLPITKELDSWNGGESWSGESESIACTTDHPVFLDYLGDLPVEYRYEAIIDASALDEERGFAALVFGNGGEGLLFVGVFSSGEVSLGELDKGLKVRQGLTSVKPDRLAALSIAIEVRDGSAEFLVDGKPAGKEPMAFEPEELAGGIGLMTQGGTAKFSGLRVRY